MPQTRIPAIGEEVELSQFSDAGDDTPGVGAAPRRPPRVPAIGEEVDPLLYETGAEAAAPGAQAPAFSTRTVADPSMLDAIEAESAGTIGSLPSKLARGYVDLNIGAAKGAGQTATNLGRLVQKVPGVTRFTDWLYGMQPGGSERAMDTADQTLTPTNTAQTVGKVGEQVAEAIVPSNAISRLGLRLASKAPQGFGLATRAGVEAAGAAGIAGAQGTDMTTAAGVAGALPVAGAAARATGRVLGGAAPQMRSAAEFMRGRGVPVDAATATDSKLVRGLQWAADRSPGGAMVGEAARRSQEAGMARVGRELAEEAYPAAAVVPETVGQGIRDAVTGHISKADDLADSAYGTLRSIEGAPSSRRTVMSGTRTVNTGILDANGQPVTRMEAVAQDVSLPVDLRPVKDALRPVAEAMERQLPVTVQRSSPGLKAIRNVLDGEDFVPASVADTDLSAIKGIARGADLPELRSVSQGLAAKAVKEMERAVQMAVKQGGPEAVSARDVGRAATREKYRAAQVLKKIAEEPVQAFNQALWRNDTGIRQLRQVAKIAPKQMRQLGRAYVDDLMTTATAQGGFTGGAGLHQRWQSLGPETKKLLYPDKQLRENLDNFFLFARKSAENPNPSGTSYSVGLLTHTGYMVTDPVGGVALLIPQWGVSKFLHSRKGVELLTNGMRVSTRNESAAGALAAQIRSFAASTGVPVEAVDRPQPEARAPSPVRQQQAQQAPRDESGRFAPSAPPKARQRSASEALGLRLKATGPGGPSDPARGRI